MRRQKTNLILLFAILIITLVSCGLDPSGSSSQYAPLEYKVHSSVDPEVRGGEYWFSEPVDITFTFSESARISYRLENPETMDGTGQSRTVEGKTVTVRCDSNCNISIYASTGNSSINLYYSVRFKNLGKVKLLCGELPEPVTEGTVEVMTNRYIYFGLDLDSFIYYDWMTVYPQIRYTTDGSDPHDSDTVHVIQIRRDMVSEDFLYTTDMTRIRAYAALDGWNSAPDTDIKIEIAKTPDPVISPSSEEAGEYDFIPYGDKITVTPGSESSRMWFTTNKDLTAENLDPDAYTYDPSVSWVPVSGELTVPEDTGVYYLKVIASEDGKLLSEIIEKTYHVQLPEPVIVKKENVDDQKVRVIFSRGDGPSDSEAYYSYRTYSRVRATELDDGSGRFSITVPTGSTINVWLEKSKGDFEPSGTVTATPKAQLNAPEYSVARRYEDRKYQLLTITPETGTVVYYRLSSDGCEKQYTKAIEFRQTDTITFWAVKDGYEDSEHVQKKVVVDYELGDVGPSGGVIIHDRGSYDLAGWRYVELARESYSGQIFGYSGEKDGESAKKTGASENPAGGMGEGAVNSSLMYSKMKGGKAFSGTTGIGVFTKVKDQIDPSLKNSFAVKTAEEFSKTITLNDRTVVFDDWYLPSWREVMGLITAHIITKDPEMKVEASWITTGNYWTSDEYPEKEISSVYIVTFNSKNKSVTETSWSKGGKATVIMMRKF